MGMRIAVDAMGGDFAPATIVDGALVAARHFGMGLALVGPSAILRQELRRHADASLLDIEIVDAPDVVSMAEPPAAALRRKPRASIRVAAELVARNDAAALFTAGHTGAAVLTAHAAFGMLPGVDRPALATTIPTRRRAAVLLDSGANLECRPHHLVQFAAMGAVYAHVALDCEAPRVGLLSIGQERTKGTERMREAHDLLAAGPTRFVGNLEASEVFSGDVDVIVCDGVSGNIALKVSEGLVGVVETLLREELSQTFTTRVGYLLSRRAFRRFQKRVDYSEFGGAPLLGVTRLCIIGHGRSSAKAVRNAVAMAYRFAERDMVGRVEREMSRAVTARG